MGCSCTEQKPLPEPDREYLEEVKSDCRSWIVAWARETNQIKAITEVKPYKTLADLQEYLGDIGVKGDLQSLRYLRIAKRMEVTPLTEEQVIQQFIAAAKELP